MLSKALKQLPGLEDPSRLNQQQELSLESIVRDRDLYKIVSKLFADGHHARSVEEAFKYLNNLVKRKAQLDEPLDGSALMKQAFSAKNPVLKLNEGASTSEQSEQTGYMEILSGCMIGIRNPRAHEHDWEDPEDRAIQLLMLANHLVERVKQATKSN
ncbi:MAG: TIGR02391 family protein [Anaerolineae bacterium]